VQRCERIDRGIEDGEEGRAAMEESANFYQKDYGNEGNENDILNRSVASASDIIPLDTTCVFGLAKTSSASSWFAYRPET
jgi:hypothetical protein